MTPRYTLDYRFEWRGPCLWAANDEARSAFHDAIKVANLPLTPDTISRIDKIRSWHDTALNWEYPPDPGPWRQEECDRFNQAAIELYEQIRRELGPDFEVVNCQSPMMEDPDLNEYLRDPKNFRRKD